MSYVTERGYRWAQELSGEDWQRFSRRVAKALGRVGWAFPWPAGQAPAAEDLLGAGYYGVVAPTVDPGWVVKVTRDFSEGPVWHLIHESPELRRLPGVPAVKAVWFARQPDELTPYVGTYVILREALMPAPLVKARSALLNALRTDLKRWAEVGVPFKAVRPSVEALVGAFPELSAVAEAVETLWERYGIGLCDVHGANLGYRAGSDQLVILDIGGATGWDASLLRGVAVANPEKAMKSKKGKKGFMPTVEVHAYWDEAVKGFRLLATCNKVIGQWVSSATWPDEAAAQAQVGHLYQQIKERGHTQVLAALQRDSQAWRGTRNPPELGSPERVTQAVRDLLIAHGHELAQSWSVRGRPMLAARYRAENAAGHPTTGFCSIAAEAVYHLTGKVLTPRVYRDPAGWTHWWLEDNRGRRYDPTREQLSKSELTRAYAGGRGCGFPTPKRGAAEQPPSARAQVLIDLVLHS